MPELPEVETTKEGIRPYLENSFIEQVIVRNTNLRLPVATNINELCAHQKIHQVSRKAKYILLHLTKGHLLIHLGMSGHLRLVNNTIPPNKHDHIDVKLSNQQVLRYCDPRRFGLFHYLAEPLEQCSLLSHLGPEPLSESFHGHYLYQKSQNKHQPIKSLIMNNQIVVGVGNIYATESLFLAGIHPATPAKKLSLQQHELLCTLIKNILRAAITLGGTTLKDFYGTNGQPGYFSIALKAYGKKKQPCLQCKNIIQSIVIAGRHSSFCPQCQPLKIDQ